MSMSAPSAATGEKSSAARPRASVPRRHRKRTPLWKTTWGRVLFVAATALSVWLTLNMPAPHTQQQPGAAQAENGQAMQQAMRPAMGASNRPESMGSLGRAGAGNIAGATGEATAKRQDAPATAKKAGRHRRQPQTAGEKLLHRARIFGRLFLFVGLGALLGGIIEGRCWYMALARSLGRITHAARLPAIVGIAMPTALASGPAADSMLVASHREGAIPTSALIAGGMANSFLAHLSHSMRAMYPVVAAIGLPGLLFFTIQMSGGLLVIVCVLLWNRFHVLHEERRLPAQDGFDPQAQAETAPAVLPWPETLKKSGLWAFNLVFRLACISVPLVLAMEWLIRAGALDFWEQVVPAAVNRYFPDELLTIVAAQMGGLVQSSTVAAGLAAQGLITGPQILLAMLTASAVGNPFRALRRNLPTAIAIFPLRIALVVVLGMQFSRLLVTLTGIGLVIWWMAAHGL